ncbi:hypothetical protein LTR56_010237 [Elasticomyces elasticus]|nr:hypothetical protein LTR56_010237 [Elasticomyces elasticus]KAK3662936.1 hypothetical protein LTR22_006340 [Elasticomyces elasticus]KAK4925292.1 hypothetical protein LTR49_007590 [Elasticomyces elasticus]KAK5761337.1 hypothetical protein LTS12_008613 [Elasticomyces elasticus]
MVIVTGIIAPTSARVRRASTQYSTTTGCTQSAQHITTSNGPNPECVLPRLRCVVGQAIPHTSQLQPIMESIKQGVNYVTETVGLTGPNEKEQTADSLDQVAQNTRSNAGDGVASEYGSSASMTDTGRSNIGDATGSSSLATSATGFGRTANLDPDAHAPGVVTGEGGRQTYSPDGHGLDGNGNLRTGSGLDAQGIASRVFGAPVADGVKDTMPTSTSASVLGASGLAGAQYAGTSWHQSVGTSSNYGGVDFSGLDQPRAQPQSSNGAVFGSTTSGRGNVDTSDTRAASNAGLSSSERDNVSTSNHNTSSSGLDSTAPGRNDINTSDRAAPSDYKPDPASTEGSAEVAANNPEMANKEAAGTTDETEGDGHDWHRPGAAGKHTATRENEDAIPTAGGVKLGEKHWGESKKLLD